MKININFDNFVILVLMKKYDRKLVKKKHPNMVSPERKKIALITGITGQDGSYLAELLLEKGYEVHGIKEDQVLLIHRELTNYIKIRMNLIRGYFFTMGI